MQTSSRDIVLDDRLRLGKFKDRRYETLFIKHLTLNFLKDTIDSCIIFFGILNLFVRGCHLLDVQQREEWRIFVSCQITDTRPPPVTDRLFIIFLFVLIFKIPFVSFRSADN